MARDKHGRDDKPKKKRKRKMRVNDMSSDDSEEEETTVQTTGARVGDEDDVDLDATRAQSPAEPVKKVAAQPDFAAWYLRQVAKELEEDLDKIRSASDFKESSLPVLINALQQGETLFSTEEKTRILGP